MYASRKVPVSRLLCYYHYSTQWKCHRPHPWRQRVIRLSSSVHAEAASAPVLRIAAGDASVNTHSSEAEILQESTKKDLLSVEAVSTMPSPSTNTTTVRIEDTTIPDVAAAAVPPADAAVPPVESTSSPPFRRSTEAWRQQLQSQLQYVEYVWKREVALLKYYGLWQYMQKHSRDLIPSRLFTTVDASSSTSIESTSAKVPFVMTVKLRTELSELGGYSEDEIRRMTPAQAHAILEQIRPTPTQPTPPQTVEEFHAATVSDAQSVAEFLHDSANPPVGTTARDDERPEEVPDAEGTTTTWYEIVEETNDGPHVVALYLHASEAEQGLGIYQELAHRNHMATALPTYRIRATRK